MATIIGNLRGSQGLPGVKGDAGPVGPKGASSLTGDGVPLNTLGSDGDSYQDNLTGNLYKKNAGTW